MIKHIRIALIFLTINLGVNAQEDVTRVTYPNALGDNDIRQDYFVELLDLALKNSEESFGPYELIISDNVLPSPRVPLIILEGNSINVMSSPETETLNNRLMKVSVPLLMGMQGLRLSFVHKDNATLFENTIQVNALKKITFGQGLGWIDTKILKDNDIKVQTTTIYDSLFGMLSQKRVHAFPRGLNEIYRELSVWQEQFPNLAIDEHIAFYYPLPVTFYVNPNNTRLKERLEAGLNNAKDSGEFDALFNRYFSDILEKSDIANRHIFILNNQYNTSQFEPEYKRHLLPVIQDLLKAEN